MNVHIHILAVWQHRTRDGAVLARTRSRVCGASLDVRGRIFTLAEVDAARERSGVVVDPRSEEHTSELQSRGHLVCRLLLEKKKCLVKLLSIDMTEAMMFKRLV